jgi:hypothetical protein
MTPNIEPEVKVPTDLVSPGSLWQAISGRPLSTDLLDWPPDLCALTSLLLQRSGAFRSALSPPPPNMFELSERICSHDDGSATS